MEADLARWYPRSADQLSSFYGGGMSLRRLLVLVRGLPRDSHCATVLDGEAAQWTLENIILARIANTLAQANGQRAGKRVPDSQMIKPKIGQAEAPKRKPKSKTLTPEEFDAVMFGGA